MSVPPILNIIPHTLNTLGVQGSDLALGAGVKFLLSVLGIWGSIPHSLVDLADHLGVC